MELETYRKLDAIEMARLVKENETTASELMELALQMVEKTESEINAVSFYDEALGREKASNPTDGFFKGIPFLVKELLPYPGLRTAFGSRLFEQFIPQAGPPFVERIDESGLLTFGNTASSELGLIGSTETLLNGVTRNPWSRDYSAGGSSGGAAAAVSAGIVPLAHASDGGGSIRWPAAVCGLFGFKPSKGRCVKSMENAGIIEEMAVDHCISKSVRDSAAFLSITEKKGAEAIYPELGFVQEPINRSLRIGFYLKTMMGKDPEPEALDVLNQTVKLCEDLGHSVILDKYPDIDGAAYSDAFFTVAGIGMAQMKRSMEEMLQRKISEDDLEPFTLELIQWAEELDADAYERAVDNLNQAGRRMKTFAEQFDVLLSPTTAKASQKLGYLSPNLNREELIRRTEAYIGYTPIHNTPAYGMCAMSVPLFVDGSGMPVGSHFAAQPGHEETLFRLAYQLERANPWIGRLPL